jgi:plasmid stabilization system protein ParE
MKIRITSSASNDLIDGFKFYENQSEGVGSFFLDSIYSDIESLVITAGIHQKFFGDYFRMLSQRFPFAIYYKLENQVILIYAVLDCRKNPTWVKRKLNK